MARDAKPVESLGVADLRGHPVWQFVNDDRREISVRPVKRLPVTSLSGKIVGTEVTLSSGRRLWGLLGNIDIANARLSAHVVTLSVERDGRWHHLARYHDYDYAERGPVSLANFLGLSVDEVFPIAFDVRPYVKGDAAVLTGWIEKEPSERLSRAEIIALAVE